MALGQQQWLKWPPSLNTYSTSANPLASSRHVACDVPGGLRCYPQQTPSSGLSPAAVKLKQYRVPLCAGRGTDISGINLPINAGIGQGAEAAKRSVPLVFDGWSLWLISAARSCLPANDVSYAQYA